VQDDPTEPSRETARAEAGSASAPRSIAGFEVVRELGRGGMGVVYLARQPSLNRLVALKVLRRHGDLDDELVARFLREAQAGAVTDAAIVPLHDFGQVDGTYYLVMTYMAGGSLKDLLAARRLGPGETVTVGRQIAGALASAHEAGVLHRDVKPSNILLDARGNPFLADFGVAQLAGKTRLTNAGMPVGTAEYMAPELSSGVEPSPASDIYALGATLYECLAGRPPFTGPDFQVVAYQHQTQPLTALPPEVPEELAEVVRKALAKEPEQRFSDAASLQEALGAASPAERIVLPDARTTRQKFTQAGQAATMAPKRAHHLQPPREAPPAGWLSRLRSSRVAMGAMAGVCLLVLGAGAVAVVSSPGVRQVAGAMVGATSSPIPVPRPSATPSNAGGPGGAGAPKSPTGNGAQPTHRATPPPSPSPRTHPSSTPGRQPTGSPSNCGWSGHPQPCNSPSPSAPSQGPPHW